MAAILAFAEMASVVIQQNIMIVVSLMVFASVALAVAGGAVLVGPRDQTGRRVQGGSSEGALKGDGKQSIRFTDDTYQWLSKLRPLYAWFLPTNDGEISVARKKLINAGYRNPLSVSKFYGIRIVLSAGSFIGILFFGSLILQSWEFQKVLLLAVACGLAGYFLPVFILMSKISTRQRLIREGFPDTLDMLLVCVEAGLGLDSAIAKVGQEVGRAHPILAEELNLTGLELRAGRGRQEALRNFADRTGVDDVQTMVTLLIQSDTLGTSVGQALRVHAFEMRAKRLLRAEEKAHKIPVKLSFPLIFGLLPVLLIVVLAPAIIRAVTFIFPALQRGMPVTGG